MVLNKKYLFFFVILLIIINLFLFVYANLPQPGTENTRTPGEVSTEGLDEYIKITAQLSCNHEISGNDVIVTSMQKVFDIPDVENKYYHNALAKEVCFEYVCNNGDRQVSNGCNIQGEVGLWGWVGPNGFYNEFCAAKTGASQSNAIQDPCASICPGTDFIGITRCNECRNNPPDPNCIPNCAGKECGPDGCYGSCGDCDLGCNCNFGNCNCR
jgi:hypothetical protein